MLYVRVGLRWLSGEEMVRCGEGVRGGLCGKIGDGFDLAWV